MYLNTGSETLKIINERLTLTQDVFKSEEKENLIADKERLTLTQDVFKFIW